MFLFHMAFSLDMMALVSGTALYIWSARNEGPGVGLAKLLGTLVILFSLTSSICTAYYGVKFWSKGDIHGVTANMNNNNDEDQRQSHRHQD